MKKYIFTNKKTGIYLHNDDSHWDLLNDRANDEYFVTRDGTLFIDRLVISPN